MTFERSGGAARIDWLDYARLLSALAVLAYHYLAGLPQFGFFGEAAQYGYLGVDFFFMISGFVIMLSVGERPASQFAAARLVRLVPAFLFCVSLTSLVVASAGDPRFTVTLPQWAANLTFFANKLGYPYIDQSYWTLQPELNFYGLVFIALLAGQRARLEALVLAWLALQWVAYTVSYSKLVFAGAYPLFVVGCLLHFGCRHGWTVLRALALAAAFTLAAILEADRAGTDYGLDSLTQEPLVVGVLALLVVAFIVFDRRRHRLPFATRVGAITYPLYLLHQAIGLIAIEALTPRVGAWSSVAVVTLGMIGLALLVSEFVERRSKPFWRALAGRIVAPLAILEQRVATRNAGWRKAT